MWRRLLIAISVTLLSASSVRGQTPTASTPWESIPSAAARSFELRTPSGTAIFLPQWFLREPESVYLILSEVDATRNAVEESYGKPCRLTRIVVWPWGLNGFPCDASRTGLVGGYYNTQDKEIVIAISLEEGIPFLPSLSHELCHAAGALHGDDGVNLATEEDRQAARAGGMAAVRSLNEAFFRMPPVPPEVK